MNIGSQININYRTAADIGIRQKVGSRQALSFPGGIALWKTAGKVMLWALPAVLSLNLLCSTLITHQENTARNLQNALTAIEEKNIALRTEKAQLTSPQMMRVAAAEKLSLYEPTAEQIQHM